MIERAARAAVHALLRADSQRAPRPGRGVERRAPVLRPGGRRATRATVTVHSPDVYRMLSARQRRPRRGVRRRPVGRRRPDRPVSDRRSRDRPLRPSPRATGPLLRTAPAAREPARAQHAAGRSTQHRRPLRPRQRDVRAVPGPRVDDVFERSSSAPDATLEEAQRAKLDADLRASRAGAATSTCSRSAPAGAGSPSTRPRASAAA